ncbi:MAG TPA: trypsin-like peptidase domain-containing protein [archaeon]|nr:trypsin-like peptidase domain-containing protein [archaeon]
MSKASSLQILQSFSDAMTELAGKVGSSVVRVRSRRGFGSGVIWTEDGYILTCSHVVGRAATVEVGFRDGPRLEARVIGHDPYADVALLKVDRTGLRPVEVGDSEAVEVGQLVFAFANPFGGSPSTTSGIITTAKASLGWGPGSAEDVIVTDAPLNPGYSGGPLVNASGQMIGLNVAYANSRGISIPINSVKDTINALINDGRIRIAHLGIGTDPVSIPKRLAAEANLDQDEGLMIFEVEPDSPAKRAGLVVGDILVTFGKSPITRHNDLYRLLTKDIIGKQIEIEILRAEQLVKLTITPNEVETQ